MQTVKQIKEWLSQYPDDLEVKFFTDYSGEAKSWLSDYSMDCNTVVAIDIGDNEDVTTPSNI